MCTRWRGWWLAFQTRTRKKHLAVAHLLFDKCDSIIYLCLAQKLSWKATVSIWWGSDVCSVHSLSSKMWHYAFIEMYSIIIRDYCRYDFDKMEEQPGQVSKMQNSNWCRHDAGMTKNPKLHIPLLAKQMRMHEIQIKKETNKKVFFFCRLLRTLPSAGPVVGNPCGLAAD